MRLDLNVLWIDDQPENIREQAKRLAHLVKQEGFHLEYRQASSVEAAKAAIGETVFADEVDLILVDYDLGKGQTGDQAIKQIRTELSYRDIIFYSAKPTRELRQLLFQAEIDGVFCSSRQDLVETAHAIFENLVKKILDVDHSRGIVMGATSEFDHIVHETLFAFFNGSSEEEKARWLTKVMEYVESKMTRITDSVVKAREDKDLLKIMDINDLLTANDKLRVLVNVLGDLKHKEHKKVVSDYISRIVPDRNLLGHVKKVIEGHKRFLRSNDGSKTITEEKLKQLRRELLEHRNNFEAIAKLLNKDSK